MKRNGYTIVELLVVAFGAVSIFLGGYLVFLLISALNKYLGI